VSVVEQQPSQDLQDVLRPRTEADASEALREFTQAVLTRFGEDLKGLCLFGSRARGDHRTDSDIDVAVVLADGGWEPLRVSIELAGVAFEPLVHTGVELQPRAIPESHWSDPSRDPDEALLRRIRADARPVAIIR
jgi:uncharacterized protein